MKRAFHFFGFLLLLACSSSPLKYDKPELLQKNDEFEKAVKIESPAESEATAAGTGVPSTLPPEDKKEKPSIKRKQIEKPKEKPLAKSISKESKKGQKIPEAEASAPSRRQPDLEDDTGFHGRRPIVDPFQVGEELTYDVHYFKVSAGEMKIRVGPMVVVNGRKAYNFGMSLKTNSVFSSFYSVDDRVEAFVDYDTLVPSVFQLHVKETSQLREARMLFDEKKNVATFWEKKVTDKGEEEKKQTWEILPYSQNVYSAVFYMRNFKWDVGKEYAFRVADDEQNLVFKGKALRKEKLSTELGEMNAIVVKPEVMLKGVFKPVGDIYIWLSDDPHRYILRIESKIKIGTIVTEVTSIKPGRN